MAQPTTIKGNQLQILIGDGGDPETFAPKCLINTTRSVDVEATTIDTAVPDCDDPDLPAWVNREKETLSVSISGAGRHHLDDSEFFDQWVTSPASKNVKVKENASGGRTLTGAFHLTRYNRQGEQRGLVDADVQLVSDGEVTFADNV